MKQIYRIKRKLDFSKYNLSVPDFELYSIEGEQYDFSENLGFAVNQDGVYIFLTSKPRLDIKRMDITPKCTLWYCGKTEDLRHRFDQHHHKDDLKASHPLYIAVAYCAGEEEITNLEKQMLSTFSFPFNDKSTNSGTIKDTVEAVRLSTP